MSKGEADPRPLTDNEINKMRNLKKKVDYLNDQMGVSAHGACHTESSSDDQSESDEEDHKVA
jgi:hypothetical protein